MYLEDNRWKNWHTRCSDAAIKNNKKVIETINIPIIIKNRITN